MDSRRQLLLLISFGIFSLVFGLWMLRWEKKQSLPDLQLTGRPEPRIGVSLPMIGSGILMLAMLISFESLFPFVELAQDLYHLRAATATMPGKVVGVPCDEPIPRCYMSYQFELVGSDRRAVPFRNEQIIYDKYMARLSRGAQVLIRYNPHDPQTSGLVGNGSAFPVVVFAGLLLCTTVFCIALPIIGDIVAFVRLLRRRGTLPAQVSDAERERQVLECEGFMLITDRGWQRGLQRLVAEANPITPYVTTHDDRVYLSFGFIHDPAERIRVWNILWKYQARQPLVRADERRLLDLQIQLFWSDAVDAQ